MRNKLYVLLIIVFGINYLFSCNSNRTISSDKSSIMQKENLDTATFGAGCFWCVEAIFSELNGVESVVPGYSNGYVDNPDYKMVCTGNTGYAEVCQIVYNPKVISFEELLEVFWTTHDPTTLNRQGNDVGTQYRSAVFYHNDEQKRIALDSKANVATKIWSGDIVTEISPVKNFYLAEEYHNDYFANNADQGYCRIVIEPKVLKFRKLFKDKLKKK